MVGKSIPRVDAFDKVTGRAKYVEDILPQDTLVARIYHSKIANGLVKSIDTTEAEKVPGVVKIVTCFDVTEKHYYPTAGHPWTLDVSHQDIADRLVLTDRVRFVGDDVAAVIAENDVAADQAVRLLKVEYEEYPFVLKPLEAIKPEAPQIHDDFKRNILRVTTREKGNYEEAIKEQGLIRVEGWYSTPIVQHCHIENHICTARTENGKIVISSSTQIPHIVRRIVGQALGMDWGKIRVIKPFIGGGFGNKQDALYEPLCAFLTLQVGGRPVTINVSREETFVSNRVRHPFNVHLISHLRADGTLVARKVAIYSNQGAYASHGHSIAAKGMGALAQLYPCEHFSAEAYTVFTNTPVAGAMRGYGIPQTMFAEESHIEDIIKKLGENSLNWRRNHIMPVGFEDTFSKNVHHYDSFNQCFDKANAYLDYEKKVELYKNQTGEKRRGVGMAAFWYNTAVWPIALETSSCRMILNQDGSLQVQLGETEIGQGADTAFTQMVAHAVGVTIDKVYVISNQDTDVTPYSSGSYASRQTYVAGFSITKTAQELRKKILDVGYRYTRVSVDLLDIVDNNLVRITDNKVVMTLADLANASLYDTDFSQHISAEQTAQAKSNAYSFGCCFVEVEVDIPLCKVELIDIINVHDCGTLINPALAEAQVHGGMSMGIGFALSENLLIDQKTGKVLNDNLLDYKLATFMDHPDLEAQFVQNAEPTSPYGTKGLGEPPTCPVAPAIRNAVLHATGIAINDLPLNPHKLFEAFKEGGLI
ncbi:MAG: xanthine dehydrogenase molybdenum-binding subunit XdhA [Epulopiscium sp. Nuni2H_MBin003]|nr:MAG: xanthine dehydrogenase molybdenum-binding subunit XdhA [Epulopiscium sp. Nuni2H_MBin003]